MPELTLADALSNALASLARVAGTEEKQGADVIASLASLQETSLRLGLHLDQVLAAAALGLTKVRLQLPARVRRNCLDYLVSDLRPEPELLFTAQSSVQWFLNPGELRRAVLAANLTIEIVHDLAIANNVPIFDLLGLCNLSSLVGEIFAREICSVERGRLVANPNQDGYPDLCALTPEGKLYVDLRLSLGQMTAKEFWSPYPHGGLEVKGTCGNTPEAKKLAKPKIGESRYPILKSAEWKAHHRETNNLVAIYWDFVDGLPTVLAVSFQTTWKSRIGARSCSLEWAEAEPPASQK